MGKKKGAKKEPEITCELSLFPDPRPADTAAWLRDELPEWIQLLGMGAVYAKDASARGSFAILGQDLAALTEAYLCCGERGVAVVVNDSPDRVHNLAEIVRAFTNAGDEPDGVGPQIEALADELVKLCSTLRLDDLRRTAASAGASAVHTLDAVGQALGHTPAATKRSA